MDVVSLCPLRVASFLWQPQRGGYVFTVVAKGTFRLGPIESRLAQEQEYPNDDDNYWNDDPARSLYSPTDLVPFKARPEVMLVGHAFAPRKEPARSVVARIVIGDVDKAIEVTGDRALLHDGQIREPVRFLKMPLRYERSAGGAETMNPVGMRSDARPDAYGGVPLPNLLPAGLAINTRADLWTPVGFGPIAPMWPSRWQKLGRHAVRFQTDAWNDSPLPDDIDPSYFNAAPDDQRPSELRDTERIVLENLHPDHPRLVTNLPGVRPCAFAETAGRAPQRVHMECDTLWIDTDRAICTLTWRGQISLESSAQAGRVVVALEEGNRRLAWSDIQRIESGAAAGPPPPPPSPPPSAQEEGTAIVDLGTVDAQAPTSARDGSRAALLGLSPASSVQSSGPSSGVPGAFTPPVINRPNDLPQARTAAPMQRRPSTLTNINLSADLPFLRSDRDAPEPSRPAPSSVQSALPFAPSASSSSSELSSTGFPRPAPPPPPPPSELSSASFPRPAMPSEHTPPPGFQRPAMPSEHTPPPGFQRPAMPSEHTPPPGFQRPLPPPDAPPSFVRAPAPPPPPPPSPPAPQPAVLSAVTDSPWAGGGPRADGPAFSAVAAYDPAGARGAAPLAAPVPPPPPSPPSPAIAAPLIAAATVGGALAASNAAAAAIAPPPPVATPVARPIRQTGAREIVDLLWFDPAILPKVREHARYKEILADIAPKPKQVSFDDDPFEDAIASEEPEEIKARREIFGVVARGESIDAEGVGEAMAEAVSDDGTFIPPLVLIAGELSFIFDELSQLKSTVAATSPFASSDKKLKETLDTVNEILQTPWIQGSTGVAEGLVQRIKEAFAQGSRSVPASYLDTQTERMLLEQRAFQKRTVFGEPYLRTLLSPLGVQSAIPTYLPEALATKLPMVLKMRVRVLAEACLPQDQYETYPASLKAVAIGRVSPLPGKR